MIYVESFFDVDGAVRWRAVDLKSGRAAVGASAEEARDKLLEELRRSGEPSREER